MTYSTHTNMTRGLILSLLTTFVVALSVGLTYANVADRDAAMLEAEAIRTGSLMVCTI